VLREYLISMPTCAPSEVTILFHPFGFTPESVVFGEPAGELLIRPLAGFAAPASEAGVVVIAPRALGRILEGVSLAWAPHIDSAWEFAVALAHELGELPVSAGGLSMGGLEALVLAGRHPEVSAVWAANPIVDLVLWHDDIASGRTSPTLLETSAHHQIEEEVGGTPSACPGDYAARSPLSYVETLAGTRVRLVWSPADTIIPGQREQHAHRLAEGLRETGGSVSEEIVTFHPLASDDEAGRFAHEACDVGSAVSWLRAQTSDVAARSNRGGE